ncbi:SDR family oxidoreductase [Calditrichota bacterium]
MELKGKNIIVTGGAGGIGSAIVRLLIENDANPVIIDNNNELMRQFENEYAEITIYNCDVRDYSQVVQCVHSIIGHIGTIHGLVNCAGIVENIPLVRVTDDGLIAHEIEAWDNVISTNLDGVFYMTANVVKSMLTNRTHGVIVNVSSVVSTGNAGQSAYAASKAAINSLTVSWANELGPLGIRVGAVSPGLIDTPMRYSINESAQDDLIQRTPSRRTGKPDEIALAVLFIFQNDFYSGKIIEIDGGIRF